jgi:hypothetical protein
MPSSAATNPMNIAGSLLAPAPHTQSRSAPSAARLIVDAAKRGAAECSFPFTATVAGRVSGLLPGVTVTVLARVDRVMPEPPGSRTGIASGAVVASGMDAPLLEAATTLGRAAAKEYNEMRPL